MTLFPSDAVKAILIAGVAAITGLHMINSTTDFHALSPNSHPVVFRIEALGLSFYVAALILSYFPATRGKGN